MESDSCQGSGAESGQQAATGCMEVPPAALNTPPILPYWKQPAGILADCVLHNGDRQLTPYQPVDIQHIEQNVISFLDSSARERLYSDEKLKELVDGFIQQSGHQEMALPLSTSESLSTLMVKHDETLIDMLHSHQESLCKIMEARGRPSTKKPTYQSANGCMDNLGTISTAICARINVKEDDDRESTLANALPHSPPRSDHKGAASMSRDEEETFRARQASGYASMMAERSSGSTYQAGCQYCGQMSHPSKRCPNMIDRDKFNN